MARDLMTIVIFSHERPRQLEVAVESALEVGGDLPVIVVDDNSRTQDMRVTLLRLARHNRVVVYRRQNLLRGWNQRGGFYPNIRFALRIVQTPFALLMEDDQQIVREIHPAELKEIAETLQQLKSPFMGVTFAHNKSAFVPALVAVRQDLFAKSAQAAYSTNAIVHIARLREMGFRIGPSAQATDAAAAAYFGPHPVWPVPLLAYRVSTHGYRFGRTVGDSQTKEEAAASRYFPLHPSTVQRMRSMVPEVPTVKEFLSTQGSVNLPVSFVLPSSRKRKPVLRRLWYFLTTRSYVLTMRIKHSLRRKANNDFAVLFPANASQEANPGVA